MPSNAPDSTVRAAHRPRAPAPALPRGARSRNALRCWLAPIAQETTAPTPPPKPSSLAEAGSVPQQRHVPIAHARVVARSYSARAPVSRAAATRAYARRSTLPGKSFDHLGHEKEAVTPAGAFFMAAPRVSRRRPRHAQALHATQRMRHRLNPVVSTFFICAIIAKMSFNCARVACGLFRCDLNACQMRDARTSARVRAIRMQG